jgi:hypothetical protein
MITERCWHWWPSPSFLTVSRKEDLVNAPGDPDSAFWKLDFTHRHLPRGSLWKLTDDESISEIWLTGPLSMANQRRRLLELVEGVLQCSSTSAADLLKAVNSLLGPPTQPGAEPPI